MSKEQDNHPYIPVKKQGIREKAGDIVENTVNSLRVAPQWHIPAFIFAVCTPTLVYISSEKLSEGNIPQAAFFGASSIMTATSVVISEVMAKGYLEKYKKIKKSMQKHGWDERIVNEEVYYYCGRRASRVAAKDTGLSAQFEEFMTTAETSWR